MPSKITHDVSATIGEYTDRQTGEKKKRYITVGKCFTDEQGRQSIKLDAVPVGPAWSGWLSLYPIDREAQQPRAAARQDPMPPGRNQQRTMPPAPPPADNHDDDDIPF